MKPLEIVIVEWMGYPIHRDKQLGQQTIRCGLGHLLENMDRYDPGMDFNCSVVFNRSAPHKVARALQWLDQFSLLQPALLNYPASNSPEKYERLLSSYPWIKNSYYRDNLNQDIGAYDFYLQHLRSRNYESDILFINSSTRGPNKDGWLVKYRDLFYANKDTGLSGISLNSHYMRGEDGHFSPHVQSFFLYSSMSVLNQVFPNGFMNNEGCLDKEELIQKGELGISHAILEAGLGISCITFPKFFYTRGSDWTIPQGDIRFQAEYAELANRC